ncbi:Protein of unknown function [Gryllus bimaculatus]|nr:Protein of unknown function [Gryllus bimaculatus]
MLFSTAGATNFTSSSSLPFNCTRNPSVNPVRRQHRSLPLLLHHASVRVHFDGAKGGGCWGDQTVTPPAPLSVWAGTGRAASAVPGRRERRGGADGVGRGGAGRAGAAGGLEDRARGSASSPHRPLEDRHSLILDMQLLVSAARPPALARPPRRTDTSLLTEIRSSCLGRK